MAQLKIQNIGPLRDLDITLNRVNVFIGPQSSGKSTIAKIISFCRWMEKDCVRRQMTSHVDAGFIQRRLIDYYNMSRYFTAESYFLYQGDALMVEFSGEQVRLVQKEGFRIPRISKNAYIPSERNLVSIPEFFQTKMPDNYISSFLGDWKQVRHEFSAANPSVVLPTEDSYYYDERKQEDTLVLKDGVRLPLSQASSGLQSITPMVVSINYLTSWIYSHPVMQSADERENSLQAALANFMDRMSGRATKGVLDLLKEADTPESMKSEFESILHEIGANPAQNGPNAELISQILTAREGLTQPAYSNLVIEEPEQNLFPQTQRLLVEYILSHHKADRDTLVLTTHSPFVLYSINNCMMAWLAAYRAEVAVEMVTDVSAIPETSFLNPVEVSVWELREGFLADASGTRNATIQDSRGLIRDNYFNRIMGNVMANFNNLLSLL